MRSTAMKWTVEQWAAEYGSPVAAGALDESQAAVDVGQELSAEQWRPLSPRSETRLPDEVAFVDGVRRVEARVWVTGDDGATRPGLCASYGAGVVLCNGAATVVDAQVRRGLFAAGAGLEPIETRHGRFAAHAVAGDSPEALSLALQAAMGDLEHHVSTTVDEGALLVVDGPLRERRLMTNAVGLIKSQHVSYLPAIVSDVLGQLTAGERTPIVLVGDRFRRWTWYLRLPGPVNHPYESLVRCEVAPDRSVDDARRMADVTAALLPRFASEPHKDKRAPQNLIPIGGLERELRRRLGDPQLLYRALRAASAA